MDVKDYFKNYPGSKECFQTADGYIFHHEGDAHLHARSLEEKEVKAYPPKACLFGRQGEEKEPESTEEAKDNKQKAKGKK